MDNEMKRIKELVNILNKYALEYYTLDNPTISDKEYDLKYDELMKLEKETRIILKNSPTQRVGDVVSNGFSKIQHKNKLWSLGKSQSKEELKKFYNKIINFCKINNLKKPKFIVSKKFDGLTLKVEYNNDGEISSASTRGTGEIGEDITLQSKTIVNLPHKINYNNILHIHGEALMTKKAFKEYNSNSKIQLKNLRNGASGALRNLDIRETAKRKLSVFFYNINYIKEKKFDSYSKQLEFLKELNLPVAKYTICETFEQIIKEIDNIEQQRNNLEFDIDGVVIAVDDMDTRKKLGYTIKFPKHSIAYKFEAQETTTKLLDIEWNVGKTGRVNPKAIIEPVNLMGSTVKRATLNNMDDIKRKNLKINSKIFIRKSNDVIPEIMGVVEESLNNKNIKDIIPPSNCPVCGSKLVKKGAYYICNNKQGCDAQLLKKIHHFVTRQAMNIDGFSIKTIEKFMNQGFIEDIIDIYKLQNYKNEIVSMEGFKEKSYSNLIKSIDKSKECKLSNFIYALGIPNVGLDASRLICKKFNNNIDSIQKASEQDLLSIDGIGETTTENVLEWFSDEKNNDLLNNLLKYITFTKEENKKEIVNGVFLNKKIYCTGTFENYKKKQLKELVENNGGTFANGYSKSLDLLVVGNKKGSNKVNKAKEDDVKVITEDTFVDMIK